MKRPATAAAGLTFLRQGLDIELAAAGVGAFLRYCERNNPGLALSITYVSKAGIPAGWFRISGFTNGP